MCSRQAVKAYQARVFRIRTFAYVVFAADCKSGGWSLAFLSMRAECVEGFGLTFVHPAISLVSSSFVQQWYYVVLVVRRDYHPGGADPRFHSHSFFNYCLCPDCKHVCSKLRKKHDYFWKILMIGHLYASGGENKRFGSRFSLKLN